MLAGDAWLTAAEVERLTDRKRHKAQMRKLADMGIPCRPSASDRPLVERSAVLTVKPSRDTAAPRWDRLRKAA